MAAITAEIDFDSMTPEQLREALAKERAENTHLKARAKKGVSMKVSEKGGVSVYGLSRFPTTLYREQWTKLLDMKEQILQFIADHEGELKTKNDRRDS